MNAGPIYSHSCTSKIFIGLYIYPKHYENIHASKPDFIEQNHCIRSNIYIENVWSKAVSREEELLKTALFRHIVFHTPVNGTVPEYYI